MTISPVHHVSLTVSDLDRSIRWYCDVLGLRKAMESKISGHESEAYLHLPPGTTGRMAMLQAGRHIAGTVELTSFDPPPRAATPPKRPGDPGAWMVAFEVVGETLEQAAARLRERGGQFWSEPTDVEVEGYPTFRAALLLDPDGILIELLQLPAPDEIRSARDAERSRDAGS